MTTRPPTIPVRSTITLLVGAAVLVALLVLPAPRREPRQAVPAGPPTLASVWPTARPFPIAAGFADGSSFYPLQIVDPQTVLGLDTSSDGRHSDLVVAGPTGDPRVLVSIVVDSGVKVGPYAASADGYFWMRGMFADGNYHYSLWTAPRAGGPARQLSADVGQPVQNDSSYDMQIVGDRLYWVSADTPGTYRLLSIDLAGGPVTSQTLPGQWEMLAWPWMMTAPGATTSPNLWNLDTGEHRPVTAPADRIVFCNLQWCRSVGATAADLTDTELAHPDGTDSQTIGGPHITAVANDVAILDRFEPLTISRDTGPATTYTVLLYDIAYRRTVHVEDNASDVASIGTFLWWSTGDDETTTWYGLDLRTLR